MKFDSMDIVISNGTTKKTIKKFNNSSFFKIFKIYFRFKNIKKITGIKKIISKFEKLKSKLKTIALKREIAGFKLNF
mgnify:CR=1 FL=1